MRNLLILCVLFMFAMPAMAKLYKCPDAEGNTVYTDEACADGKQIKLPPSSTYTPKKISPIKPTNKKSKGLAKDKYESLIVNTPVNDSVIHNSGGVVNVSYTLVPGIKSALGHKFSIVVDGKQLKTKGLTSQIRLSDMYRGTHTVQINVVDEKKVLISSETTSFHIKQTSVLHPKAR